MTSGDGRGRVGQAEVDLDVVELLVEMAEEGFGPALIVFLGDAGAARLATRGVDPADLLRDLARESARRRPCRRGAKTGAA